MRKIFALLLLASVVPPATAQRLLSLDSCRAMALRNNKQMMVSKVKQDVAANIRKSARTKYLPHISALGGYEWTSREISLLSDEQKNSLPNLGTTAATAVGSQTAESMSQLPQSVWQTLGVMGISPEMLQGQLSGMTTSLAGVGNHLGQSIVNGLHTDTRNIFAGAVMLTQPVFMGGAIVAMNKMADIGEQMAANSTDGMRQQTLYNTDQAYWQVVSLHHKQQLAQAYLNLVKKLDDDVQKMIREGVATRSEELSVSVKVNEAEMTLTKVDDGLALSKMLLCQLCGLPLNEEIVLADATADISQHSGASTQIDITELAKGNELSTINTRPELRQLQNVVDMSRQLTNILKAGNLPQVALTGGYLVTNPNLFNGYQRKFGGMWNVGVLVRVPIWNWGDVAYKVRASKGATAIASLELQDAQEKISLQVSQSRFRVTEANKKLALANTSVQRAEENLRTAQLGFREGVISSTTVMEAQTAWLQAQSQKIDAEIDLRLSDVNLRKALGVLNIDY